MFPLNLLQNYGLDFFRQALIRKFFFTFKAVFDSKSVDSVPCVGTNKLQKAPQILTYLDVQTHDTGLISSIKIAINTHLILDNHVF